MRIAVVATHPVPEDPHARPLVATLVDAGHDVRVVTDAPGLPSGMEGRLAPVATPGPVRRRAARLPGGPDLRDWSLGTTLRDLRPDLVHVLRRHDVRPAAAAAPAVLAPLAFGSNDRDLRWLAPGSPGLAADTVASTHHTPSDDRASAAPAPGRHVGRRVAVAGRLTATNPSRYLVAALERAGVEVVRCDGEIDWDALPDRLDGVLVVESPWPALPVVGRRRADVPLAFWVHHGEHHLPVNLRLARRYDADVVLLAHSWHLAHRFSVPVHRFPFAVAPELFGGGLPWEERDLDVAVVAAGLGDNASPRYPRRAAWTEALAPLGERAALVYGLLPEQMAELYARARLVLNEGGTKHLPITMRVFEAVGSGAHLVTDPLPGTELLLGAGSWSRLDDEHVHEQVEALAADPATRERAEAAADVARGRHTYDHRVDELLDVLLSTSASPGDRSSEEGLGRLLADDVEVQTVAGVDVDPAEVAPAAVRDRAAVHGDEALERLCRGRFDAVVVAGDAGVRAVGAERLLEQARRYVYAGPSAVRELERHAPGLDWEERDGWARLDRGAPGYRVRDPSHPLAG